MAWNGSNGASAPQVTPRKSPASPWRGAVALLIIVALGGAAYLLVSRDAPKPTKPVEKAERKTIAEVKPAEIAAKKTPESILTPKPVEDELPPNKRIVEMISVVTNADGSVLERFRTADGKTRSRQSAPKAVFDNASDQLIAMAVQGAASGGSMPPMPVSRNADAEFKASLEKPIGIEPGDSEEIKALKHAVMETRKQILELMSEGKSFEEVMQEHRELVNNNATVRNEVTTELKRLLEEGDFDGAEQFREKANALLIGFGADPVEMPMTREERRQAVREAHGLR